jgi:hypothetical protein
MKYPTKSIAARQGNNLNAKKVAISAFAAPEEYGALAQILAPNRQK